MHYPQHVAIIPDGNRTRARENGKTDFDGHLEGVERGMEIIRYTFEHTGVKVITGWGMSTENVKERDPASVKYLCDLFKIKGESLNDFLEEHKINFRRVGSPVGLDTEFVQYLKDKQKKFSFDSEKAVVFAINYGGRDEIIRGVHAFLQNHSIDQLTEETLSRSLDFRDLPPLDLVIRTKGDLARRTSGLMSWWIGYAELYFTEKKYPEFTVQEYQKALERFDKIIEYRNFGK